jgi:hypothetical protein
MERSWMLHRVALIRTDLSEELSASIIRVTIGELGTTLALTSYRRTLHASVAGYGKRCSSNKTNSVAFSQQAIYTD